MLYVQRVQFYLINTMYNVAQLYEVNRANVGRTEFDPCAIQQAALRAGKNEERSKLSKSHFS